MKNKKCINCPEYSRCRESSASWIFFIIGLIATIAMRVVTVLMDLNPFYGKMAWYIGVSGFFLFFIYKFKVSQTRSKIISERELVDKIASQKQLTKDDYNLIGAILCSLSSRKERINYFFIFGLSAVVLVVAIFFDLFR
ncbi:hypothetical protein KAS42_05745 [bacterium]|nr:hypothetical protein [bacterium]